MIDGAIPAQYQPRPILAPRRNDRPENRAGAADPFHQNLLSALTPQMWARGLALRATSAGQEYSGGTGAAAPADARKAAGSDAGMGDQDNASSEIATAIGHVDPTTLAAQLLVTPFASGRSELARAVPKPGTDDAGTRGASNRPSADDAQALPGDSDRSSRAGQTRESRGSPTVHAGTPSGDSQGPSAVGTRPPSAQEMTAGAPTVSPSVPNGPVRAIAVSNAAPGSPAGPAGTVRPASSTGAAPRSGEGVRAMPGAPLARAISTSRGAGASPTARNAAPSILRAEPDTPVGQFGRGLSAVLRQGGGSVTLRLNPESLGHVKISLSLEESRVWARFEAANPETRQLLTQHADSLRQALEARGLSVEHITIVHEADSAPTSTGRASDSPAPPQHSRTAFENNDHTPGRDRHAGQNPEQSTGGAPWSGEHDRAAETHGEILNLGPTTPYAGLEAGELWLRLDAIA